MDETRMTDCSLILERWGVPFLYEEQEWMPNTLEEITETITGLSSETSAVLYINLSGYRLDINASNDLYSIGIQLPTGRYFEFVGTDQERGKVDYVVGGQLVDFPKRYLVSRKQVLAVVKEFLDDSGIDVNDNRWDKERPTYLR